MSIEKNIPYPPEDVVSAAQIKAAIELAPVGLLYQPDFYTHPDGFWQQVAQAGEVYMQFSSPIGDTLLSSQSIKVLIEARRMMGVPFKINVLSRHGILDGWSAIDDDISILYKPSNLTGNNQGIPVINMDILEPRSSHYYNVPRNTHERLPIDLVNPLTGRRRSLPQMIYRGVEVVTGVKTTLDPAEIPLSLPLTTLDSETHADINSLFTSFNPYEPILVTGNSSSTRSKCYEPEQFRDIIARITRDFGVNILYLNDPSTNMRKNDNETRELLKELRLGNRLLMTTQDLSLIPHIMFRCHLGLFPDTGLAHIAAAMGKPTVVGYTGASHEFWSNPASPYIPVTTPYAKSLYGDKVMVDPHIEHAIGNGYRYRSNRNSIEGMYLLGVEPFIEELQKLLINYS